MRPYKKPAYLKKTTDLDTLSITAPTDHNAILLNMLSSPTISSKKWIFEQFDHMVRTNTVIPPGSDSAIIRLKDSRKAIAITTNCNSRYCYLDPHVGAAIAVAESARNLACCGATPLAITDCLNFGNPENPETMWQFMKSIEGLSEAARVLKTPVVSGNVSFYNETDGKAIYPTPTVAMVGLINDINTHVSQWFKRNGDIIALLGETKEEFGGSEYQKQVQGKLIGRPPHIDLNAESALIDTLLSASQTGILQSAHDLSEGGLAVAISESCFTPEGPIGVKIRLDNGMTIRHDALLFSESQSRALVSLDRKDIPKLEKISEQYSVPMELIGQVDEDRLFIDDLIDIPVVKAHETWASAFANIFQSYA